MDTEPFYWELWSDVSIYNESSDTEYSDSYTQSYVKLYMKMNVCLYIYTHTLYVKHSKWDSSPIKISFGKAVSLTDLDELRHNPG